MSALLARRLGSCLQATNLAARAAIFRHPEATSRTHVQPLAYQTYVSCGRPSVTWVTSRHAACKASQTRISPGLARRMRAVGLHAVQGYSNGQPDITSTSTPERPANTRVYTSYAVYKGKAAMAVKLIGPTWKPMDRGGLEADREGVMLLEFAHVNASAGGGGYAPQAASGDRTYNWGNKITFALKPVELGALLTGSYAPNTSIDFFHDPNKGGPNSGMISKTLKVETKMDGNTMVIVSSTDKGASSPQGAGPSKSSVSVVVSPAELEVIMCIARFAIPRLLGFDAQLEA